MSVQGFIAKLLLALPQTWLMKLSGGQPHVIGERTMDPHMQFVMHSGRKNPPLHTLGAEGAREASNAAVGMLKAKGEAGISISNSTVPASDGYQIPIRIYRPDAQNPDAPLMVYYHQEFHSNHYLIVSTLIISTSVAFIIGLTCASAISRFIGPTVQIVLNRLLGMIVGSLGVEFIIEGVRDFFF